MALAMAGRIRHRQSTCGPQRPHSHHAVGDRRPGPRSDGAFGRDRSPSLAGIFDLNVFGGARRDDDSGNYRLSQKGTGPGEPDRRHLHRDLRAGGGRAARRPTSDNALGAGPRTPATIPKVKVEEDRIFVEDGPIWTSAGMTAGLDLALAFIERDIGIEVARSVARTFVMYHRRTGGQSQFSTLLELEPKSDRIQKVLTYARRHLDNRLNVEELAGLADPAPGTPTASS